MVSNICNKYSLRVVKRRYLTLKGIFSRCLAYKAPNQIQIDLTDKCNSNCIVCWMHSPLANKRENKELNFKIVKDFIKEVSKLGTREIVFSGGGEPFFYPKIWEIFEFTQKMGLAFHINTNFTLLDKKEIAKLISFNKLVSITVSFWAGEDKLYSKLHNRPPDLFYKIKDNLRFINISKSSALHVILYGVINSVNYCGLKSLFNFAVETKCNGVEFSVPDVIPGATDAFLLNKEQLNSLKYDFISIANNINKKICGTELLHKDIFFRRISNQRACYGEYDSLIDTLPCYTGWFFLRLRANGDFNSCLKSHRIPVGNICKNDFSSIWNNVLQQQFREKSLCVPKDKEYFRYIGNANDREIGCKRICDNISLNKFCREIIRYLFWR